MNNFLTLSGFLCFGILTHTAFAANCTVTSDASTVNLNLATNSLLTNVYFRNCTNRVRPSFQWTNTKGNVGAFYLDNQPNTSIEVPFNARVGGSWDNTSPSQGGGQTANSANVNFDTHFGASATPKNLTLYTQFLLKDFEDLSRYPAGIYRTSMIFSVNEF
ncbi:hypothetical protein [Acinetobacter sp. TSRC1-2]|uniref:hypothetical protein n=1 Tax=unclassified Acinetobacter TaxID=196816 RepID=UPI003CF791B0